MSTIPRQLSKGKHDDSAQGACVMELVSLLANEEFSDYPTCVNSTVTGLAQWANDRLGDTDRQKLMALVPRIMRCRRTDADRWINLRLAIWSAERVLDLIVDNARKVQAQAWIDAAKDHLEHRTASAASASYASASASAAASAYAASSAAASASASSAAASAAYAAASYAASYAAASSYASAAYAAYAYASAAYALSEAAVTDGGVAAEVFFLDELLDQWELAAKAEDQDVYVPADWEDAALAFVAELTA